MTIKPTNIKPMSNKAPEIKDAIEAMFPGTAEAIASSKCPLCRKPIGEFRDELSLREYGISGMCQSCQDKVFVPLDRND